MIYRKWQGVFDLEIRKMVEILGKRAVEGIFQKNEFSRRKSAFDFKPKLNPDVSLWPYRAIPGYNQQKELRSSRQRGGKPDENALKFEDL